MSLQAISQQIIVLEESFNIWLFFSLFILMAISEFGISIPFLLETMWILAGYQAYSGSLSIFQLLILWLVVASGRIVGALVLFYLAGLGSSRIIKIYNKLFQAVITYNDLGSHLPVRFLRNIKFFSPYSIAFGRLFWLKIPLTLTMGIRKQLKPLIPAVLLSSFIWDAVHIIVGAVGRNNRLPPPVLILYTISAFTLISVFTLAVKWVIKFRRWNLDNRKGHSYNID